MNRKTREKLLNKRETALLAIESFRFLKFDIKALPFLRSLKNLFNLLEKLPPPCQEAKNKAPGKQKVAKVFLICQIK
jgi:hypothetical protein